MSYSTDKFLRVLILLSDHRGAKELTQILVDLGYDPLSPVESASAALSLAERRQADLAIIEAAFDVQVNGGTLVRHLREDERLPVVIAIPNAQQPIPEDTPAGNIYPEDHIPMLRPGLSAAQVNTVLLAALHQHWSSEAKRASLGAGPAELQDLSARLITVQEQERGRIAGELHDDLGQRAAIVEMEAEYLARLIPEMSEAHATLQELRSQIRSLADSLREVSHRLHPAILSDLGLVHALRTLAEEFQQNGLDVNFFAPAETIRMSPTMATALYRIAQEALRNVCRHAQFAPVDVVITLDDMATELTIEDAGPGFDADDMTLRGGLGLVSMRERARAAGGSFHLTSSVGEGTQICVRLPRVNTST